MTDFDSSCSGCSGRREFLRTALTGAASIAALSALGPVNAIAALAPRAPGGSVRYALPAADGVSIDSANEVILCRTNGEVFAFALSCPHQNTALKTMPKNAGFQCPRHKSKYLPNGTFVSGRATRNMDRLQISRESAQIIVDPDVAFESDVDPAKWAAALVKV
ncbi:ubiquinol-cytochrome c reductase iron-sulfur subunit [Gemmatimonas groenlandica]|uniref:Rieske 2Fe-2S domain-containing protein n=1 Tax=Gemmatimonas groenlandica TaxID=2732249 RepID=A0A6M4ILK4_9BACT|nr:Rieske 2Fe-2S domain-containing protein [Gemmatimonas groenlandica]QJR34739.1 Rieske 2Fe-2S domain-containing protein [Gemmatimonas groenlandica]